MAKFKIKSGTYTGTGSGFSVSGLGFTPNFGFIKATNSTSDGGQIKWTGGLSSNQSFDPTSSSSPVTDGITSFDADGFTVSTNSTVNTSGSTYTWVMMSIPSANMEGGTYTGNGTSSNPVTALGNGDLLIIKRSGSAQGGWIFGSNSPNRATWTTGNPSSAVSITATGFTVNTTSSVLNSSGATYLYFILKVNSAWGVQSSYTGDGVDGRSLSLSITPEFIWIKGRTTNSAPIFRSLDGNSGLYSTQWVANTADGSNDVEGFISLGVTLGSSGSVNANSKDYDYLALKNEVTITTYKKEKSIAYSITKKKSSTKSTKYTIKKPATPKTKSVSYKIKNKISTTKSERYAVKRKVSSTTKTITYRVDTDFTTQKTIEYRIIKENTPLNKSIGYKIAINTPIIASVAYKIQNKGNNTKSLVYRLKTNIAPNKDIVYMVRTTPDKLKQELNYIVNAGFQIPKDVKYTIVKKSTTPVEKTITYYLNNSTGNTKTINYLTINEVSALQKTVKYAVEKSSTPTQKYIEYTLVPSYAILKTIAYNVAKTNKIQKTLEYNTGSFDVEQITKELTYSVYIRKYPYKPKINIYTPFQKI